MARIPKLIAEELTEAEKEALRLFGLGNEPTQGDETRILLGLRLVAIDPVTGTPGITRLGKEVLGEVILAAKAKPH